MQLLQSHLFPQGDGIIHTLAVGAKDHRHIYGIGGHTSYARLRRFILNTLKERSRAGVHFTTLCDLYGLPPDFPGKSETVRNAADPSSYVRALEEAFRTDIDHYRFIPHLQLHEYETMLFADPRAFAVSFEKCEGQIQQLNAVVAASPSVEHIDDGVETAPSKRIIKIIPEYAGRKASAGPDIAEYIGLEVIRRKCPHFDRWLAHLEAIDWQTASP
jgi:hypothetical protein